jgi:HK97 gp10 family phage protein
MKIETFGFDDFDKTLTKMGEEFGYTDVNKKVLVPALKAAMMIALPTAKSLAREDTGEMKQSIRVDARRPTDKDQDSKYVYSYDAAIAILSVKKSRVSLGEEFGTEKKAAHPFIRPALESNQANILNTLNAQLKAKIDKYQTRKSKDRL